MEEMDGVTEPADVAALVRYGCYQRVWQLVRSCRQVSNSPESQVAYARVERTILEFMDEEWLRLVPLQLPDERVA